MPPLRKVSVIAAAAAAVACGQPSGGALGASTIRPSPASTPTSLQDARRSAVAALDQAVSGYNQLLASDGPALHAAYARRDGAKIHAAALSLLLATEGFDSTLQPVANFGPARVDETTLMTTNQRVGAALESILEAANFSDVASAYAQLQVAQRAEQANLDQVARDVGAPAPLKLASITG